MKQLASISLRLALICAVAAAVLALINSVTAPQIEYNREQRLLQALQEVSGDYEIGDAEETDAEKITARYPLSDQEGNLAGYTLRILASGYAGEMVLMAGYRLDGTVITARLLDNEETPGLGKEAEEPSYMEKFEGTGGDQRPVPQRKHELSEAQADGVTGSTITFSGIGEGIHAGSRYVAELGGEDE